MSTNILFREIFQSLDQVIKSGDTDESLYEAIYIRENPFESEINSINIQLEALEKKKAVLNPLYNQSEINKISSLCQKLEIKIEALEKFKCDPDDIRNLWFNRKNPPRKNWKFAEERKLIICEKIWHYFSKEHNVDFSTLFETIRCKMQSFESNHNSDDYPLTYKKAIISFYQILYDTIFAWEKNNDNPIQQALIFSVLFASLYHFYFAIEYSAENEAYPQDTICSCYLNIQKIANKEKGIVSFDFRTNTSYDQICEFGISIDGFNPRDMSAVLKEDSLHIVLDNKGVSFTIPKNNNWRRCADELNKNKKQIYEIAKDLEGKIQYNDEIVGVLSSKQEQHRLKYEMYHVDYFTHRIIEEYLYRNSITPLSINDITSTKEYAFRRTSIGVNVIVYLPKENAIFLGMRSDESEYNNGGKLYLSVVETVDNVHTDFSETTSGNECAIVRAIKRGMKEEIGILPTWYQNEDIHIVSAFYTNDYQQDNIFAIVILNENMNFTGLQQAVDSSEDYHFEFKGKPVPIIAKSNSLSSEIISFIIRNHDKMISQTEYGLYTFVKWFNNNLNSSINEDY